MNAAQFIRDLERTRDETMGYFSLPDGDLARTYGPGKWNVRYVLHHLVDSETVLYYRIRRVLSEPRQVIWYYDQAAKFNQTAWEFLKKYELQSDPQYQKYKWDQ